MRARSDTQLGNEAVHSALSRIVFPHDSYPTYAVQVYLSSPRHPAAEYIGARLL